MNFTRKIRTVNKGFLNNLEWKAWPIWEGRWFLWKVLVWPQSVGGMIDTQYVPILVWFWVNHSNPKIIVNSDFYCIICGQIWSNNHLLQLCSFCWWRTWTCSYPSKSETHQSVLQWPVEKWKHKMCCRRVSRS